jgi:penicillin-insensitive murein DD-endopeptidase
VVAERYPRTNLIMLAGVLFTGCFGSPTPLAPGVCGSVGLPYHGVLTAATELPPSGPGYARYRPFGSRNFGTPTLVRAIERAAVQVETLAPDGKRLLIGDLSAKIGGKVSGHASHRTGRDVDLLYYANTLDGVPVTSPGFIHFASDGLARTPSGGYLQLDARREWLLIRALLTDPEAEVLWIFVSRDIEAIVTDYALSIGEPAELVSRAIRVLYQPRDSANHDDHIHVRVACTLQERAAGCDSGGPAWPWLRLQTVPDDASIPLEISASERDPQSDI